MAEEIGAERMRMRSEALVSEMMKEEGEKG